MGRHASRWRWLPLRIKPQHRFVVAISGIMLLAFTTLALAATVFPKAPEAEAAPTPADETTTTAPALNAEPAAGQLIAYYVVPLNAVWESGFQAQVLITNASTAPQGWQVALSYPEGVEYVDSSVDGAPPPSVDLGGERFTFTGAIPIAAGQTAHLRVEFSKPAALNLNAVVCTVNGRQCGRP